MPTAELTLSVPDISCGHCKQAIESAVADLADVHSVEVDVDAKTVHVVGGDSEAVVAAVVNAGYEVAR